MTVPWWIAAGCLAGAAAVAGWPSQAGRARRRAVIDRPPAAAQEPGPRAQRVRRQAISSALVTAPRRTVLAAAALAGCVGVVAAGPVGAITAAAYGGLGVLLMLRRHSARTAAREHRRRLDGLCALAADLRAGLPVPAAMSAAFPGAEPDVVGYAPPATFSAAAVVGPPSTAVSRPAVTHGPRRRAGRAPTSDLSARIPVLTRAAVHLAEQTGAPLADLVERIEADARAMDRGLAAAAAQAAGARATAWLLAGLPLGGIALGYGIGVDPLDVLMHTPIGAGCAVGAIGLQLAGLAWTDRLSRGATRAA